VEGGEGEEGRGGERERGRGGAYLSAGRDAAGEGRDGAGEGRDAQGDAIGGGGADNEFQEQCFLYSQYQELIC